MKQPPIPTGIWTSQPLPAGKSWFAWSGTGRTETGAGGGRLTTSSLNAIRRADCCSAPQWMLILATFNRVKRHGNSFISPTAVWRWTSCLFVKYAGIYCQQCSGSNTTSRQDGIIRHHLYPPALDRHPVKIPLPMTDFTRQWTSGYHRWRHRIFRSTNRYPLEWKFYSVKQF